MRDLSELEKARKKALEKYQELRDKLFEPHALLDFAGTAQEANDAWLEFKKIDLDFSNSQTLKKIGDLYGG